MCLLHFFIVFAFLKLFYKIGRKKERKKEREKIRGFIVHILKSHVLKNCHFLFKQVNLVYLYPLPKWLWSV